MRKMLFGFLARVCGVNFVSTPADVIVDQLNEPRALPLGRKEFEEWSHRLIAGAMLPPANDEDAESFYKSQQYALSGMIMHLGPTESHKPDAFFIHSLRKVVCNQVAHMMMSEIKTERDEKAKAKLSAVPKDAAEVQ